MATTDRRSGGDRRTDPRRNLSIDVEWEAESGRSTGTLGDLSVSGCFVLCSGAVTVGEPVKIFLPLGEGMKVQMLATVRNCVAEIGFGASFFEPTEAQLNVVTNLMESFGEKA
ncbi:MAG: PilZ domain-containing protein [Pyrinomonadaceae bacterium]